ncbi:MAG: aspartate--tRNA(Asn) ligase [Chlamydiae bacterium RIFCSPHIGHO2_12_FULL_49_9]|nr:MAG: aspartate--tRNA(Asn) ligase [Chlamydiae bacterium RIFCSPHIGHO2_12_FULL_49_9]
MQQRLIAKQLTNSIGKEVKVRGWLNNLRALGKLAFLLLRDRSGLIQVVIENKDELAKVEHLHPGSILSIKGRIASSSSAYKVEIVDPKITVENPIHEVPPLEYYKPEIQSDLDFILDHRPVALRNRQIQAVFRIQAEMAHAFRLYMHDQVQAVEYFAPNIIGASSEGGSEFFNVDYFGYTATLAQSSQLYKQIMVGVNERVFALMPFFRAEPSQTTRHLSEGKQFEFEMGFFDNWKEILDIQEECIKFTLSYLHTHCKAEIETLGGQIIKAPADVPFPRLSFKEAQELYFERTGIDERHEPDLSPAAERDLSAWAHDKFGTDLLFITDWKIEKRPFYAYPKENDPTLTNTFDLLCAGTEITSGGQRRHTYKSMLEGIRLKGMDPAHFSDYLSIFQYGMPPHGGFGMGLERLTMTFLKLKNIREASLFPSDTKRIAGNRIKAKIVFGGENIRNEIIHQLHTRKIPFEHLVHEPTPTSVDSARVRSSHLEEGVKALILRGKQTKKNYQFNIPAHLKLDMKAASEAVGEKCEFEDPAIILERFGLKVGGVPPFGHLLNIDNYFDQKILSREKAGFNCGLSTESIVMKSKDLIILIDPKMGAFSKE